MYARIWGRIMWDIKRIWRRKIEENRREKVLFSNTDLRKLIKSIYISAFAMNILVVLAVPFVISIYGLSEEASSYARQILYYHFACVVTIWLLSFSLPNTLRAAAAVKFTMGTSISSIWVFRIGFSVVLGREYSGDGWLCSLTGSSGLYALSPDT